MPRLPARSRLHTRPMTASASCSPWPNAVILDGTCSSRTQCTELTSPPFHQRSALSGGSKPDNISDLPHSLGSLKMYKSVEVRSLVSSAAVQLPPVPLTCLLNLRPGAVIIYSFSRHPQSSCSPKSLSPPSLSALSPSTP